MYGWVGVDRHSSDIAALKERLIRQNGLVGLEAFEPNEIEDVKRVFYRDGFVLVKNALTSDQLSEAQNGSYRVISEIMALDAKRDGNRGSHRYSFGAALSSKRYSNPLTTYAEEEAEIFAYPAQPDTSLSTAT